VTTKTPTKPVTPVAMSSATADLIGRSNGYYEGALITKLLVIYVGNSYFIIIIIINIYFVKHRIHKMLTTLCNTGKI